MGSQLFKYQKFIISSYLNETRFKLVMVNDIYVMNKSEMISLDYCQSSNNKDL